MNGNWSAEAKATMGTVPVVARVCRTSDGLIKGGLPMAEFKIAHMYPQLMNLYGDRGNLLCLKKRLQWYGHQPYIYEVSVGSKLDYHNIDMIYMGGGSEREVELIYQDLVCRGADLKEAIENGLPMLFIDTAYHYICNFCIVPNKHWNVIIKDPRYLFHEFQSVGKIVFCYCLT